MTAEPIDERVQTIEKAFPVPVWICRVRYRVADS
jgi:hypothetical protein